MSLPLCILTLGLVNWLATLILVDSGITRPLRDWMAHRRDAATLLGRSRAETVWGWVRHLICCHLCAGILTGLGLAVAVPGVRPFGTGPVGWALAGLLVGAVGHLTLVAHRVGAATTSIMTGIVSRQQRTPGRVLTRQEHAEMAELLLAQASMHSADHRSGGGRARNLVRADMATKAAQVHATLATLDDPTGR